MDNREIKIETPKNGDFVINALINSGHKAYYVGGCIRDSIMGITPKDWDICTDAKPEQISSIFKGHKTIPTGIKHGTITVGIDSELYEITTYRIDGKYSDNRRPDSVEFTDNLKEDLSRRDFTMNAIAYNSVDGIVDPFDGAKDIKNNVLKAVGNAHDRFIEDPLRILRMIRFCSVYGFTFAYRNYLEDITIPSRLLTQISSERIYSEFSKAIMGKYSFTVLNTYKKVIEIFIPRISKMFEYHAYNSKHNLDVWNHTMEALRVAPEDLDVRLALFFHDISKPECFNLDEYENSTYNHHATKGAIRATVILENLKFPRDTIEMVCFLISKHEGKFKTDRIYVKNVLRQYGYLKFKKLIDMKMCDDSAKEYKYSKKKEKINKEILSTVEDIIDKNECYSLKQLAINGKDLIENGYEQGSMIGHKLNELLDLVIEGKIENKKEILCSLI